MIKKMIYSLIFLCGMSVYADQPSQTTNKSANDIFTEPAKAILVKKANNTVIINLRSNPTTGFIWVLQGNYNHDLIHAVNHVFHPPTSRLLGAPGYESFEFKLSESAFTVPEMMRLTFRYLRPWVIDNPQQKMVFRVITIPSPTNRNS